MFQGDGASAIDRPDAVAEAALVERARAGSLPSFTALVRAYQPRLFNFHRRRVGCPEDAADLTQETFIRAWQQLHRYDARWRFSTWIYTIATRLSINHLQAGTRRRRLHDAAPAPDGPTDPADDVARHDGTGRLWPLVRRHLSPEAQTALWLRYVEDLSIAEIARVLGRTRVATRVLLFRARERLAGHLEPRGDDAPRTAPAPATAPVAAPLTEGLR